MNPTRICNDAARVVVSRVEELTGKELPLSFCTNLVQLFGQVAQDIGRLEAKAEGPSDSEMLDWMLDLIRLEGINGLADIKWTNPADADPMEEDDVILDRPAIRAAMSATKGGAA